MIIRIFAAALLSIFIANVAAVAQSADPNTVFVEFTLPSTKNGPFKNTIDQQILKSWAVGLKAGWQPLADTNTDSGIKGALAKFGITFDGTIPLLRPFKRYLYTQESSVPYNQMHTSCYSYDGYYDQYYWDGTCYPCSTGGGYCEDDSVYGRNRFVKYEEGSIAVGMFLPVQVAEKLRLEGGANYREHFISEGIQDNALTRTYEGSVDVVAGFSLQVKNRVAFTGSYEYSVQGRKYHAYQFGVRIGLN
jgi:hypothetical protein